MGGASNRGEGALVLSVLGSVYRPGCAPKRDGVGSGGYGRLLDAIRCKCPQGRKHGEDGVSKHTDWL